MDFVRRTGSKLTLGGQPYSFTGFNMPYVMRPAGGNTYLTTALNAWGSGPTAARVFCFQTYNIVSGAIDWTLLDSMMANFTSHNVRAILVLGNNRASGTNDDGALKDLTWWQGGYASQVQSTSTPAQVVTYKEWVRQVVTRYKDNPAVLMWQLMNEAQAINANGTGTESSAFTAMTAFVNDVAAMVKGIDTNHPVSLGNILGYNGGGGGQQWTGSQTFVNPPTVPSGNNGDYQQLLSNANLDVGDYHDYGYPSYPLGIPDSLTAGLIGLDSALAIGVAAGKPIMVGECGIDFTASNPTNPNITPNTTAQRAVLHTNKLYAMFQAGVAGVCLWSWRNSPSVGDGTDYGLEVGPSDPMLSNLAIVPYLSTARLVGSSAHYRLR